MGRYLPPSRRRRLRMSLDVPRYRTHQLLAADGQPGTKGEPCAQPRPRVTVEQPQANSALAREVAIR